jgi:hydroxyethylthiazole kinase-like uncharacterized protein yjeF
VAEARRVDDAVLAAHPLPGVDDGDDKEARGRVLVVGGSGETAGAAILAGLAALRAGAGKLQVACAASAARAQAVTLTEARVIGVAETPDGCLSAELEPTLHEALAQAAAVLIGPGLLGEPAAVRAHVAAVLAATGAACVVLDAAAIYAVADEPSLLEPFRGRAVLTPNESELASLLGREGRAPAGPEELRALAARTGAAIATMRGVADADAAFDDETGGPGLGTSGSGDVLSGIVAGLAARGAEPLAAALWGRHLHGRAGDRLAERIAPLGFLARELLDEVPRELAAIQGRLAQRGD